MRALRVVIWLLLPLLWAAGCSGVYTTTQLEPEREPAIVGRWVGEEDEDDVLVITQSADGYVAEAVSDKGKEETTPFTLSRVGGALFFQSPVDKCADFRLGEEPCYFLIRVQLDESGMRLLGLSPERLAADSLSGTLTLPHELHRRVNALGRSSNNILLQGSPAELRATLSRYLDDDSAFEEMGRLRRVD